MVNKLDLTNSMIILTFCQTYLNGFFVYFGIEHKNISICNFEIFIWWHAL